jgi:hypothetical protein
VEPILHYLPGVDRGTRVSKLPRLPRLVIAKIEKTARKKPSSHVGRRGAVGLENISTMNCSK